MMVSSAFDSNSDTAQPARVKKWAIVAIKGVISIAILWLLIRHVSIDPQSLIKLDIQPLAFAILIMIAQPLLVGLRWRLLIERSGGKLAPLRSIAINYIANFFSLFLPSAISGDLIRIWYAKRNHVSVKITVSSVLEDRIIALVSVILLIAATLPTANSLIQDKTVLLSLQSIAAAGIIGTALLLVLKPIAFHFKQRLRTNRYARHLELLQYIPLGSVRSWQAMGMALVTHAMTCWAMGLIAQAYGMQLSPQAMLVLVPPIILALALPISIGGWGVREAAAIAAFGSISISSDIALKTSLMFGVLTNLVNLPGLPIWLLYRHKKA